MKKIIPIILLCASGFMTTAQTREELDYVGNDYRYFVSLVAFGLGSGPNIWRNFTCSTFGSSRSFRDSTSNGTRSGLTLRERESFC